MSRGTSFVHKTNHAIALGCLVLLPITSLVAAQTRPSEPGIRTSTNMATLNGTNANPVIRHNPAPTPLQLAVQHGQLARVALLMDQGADVNVRDRDGNTLLHVILLQSGGLRVYERPPTDWLARMKSDPRKEPYLKYLIGRPDEPGPHPLLQTAGFLLACGLDPASTNLAGRTAAPLMRDESLVEGLLLFDDDRAVLLKLLGSDAGNFNHADATGDTPLHRAGQDQTFELVAGLIAGGANVNAVDRQGRTPLHRFVQKLYQCGPESPLQLLLDAKADPNVQDDDGLTPLHVLALADTHMALEATQALLAAGANPNWRDRHGHTPIHHFLQAREWWTEADRCIELLVKAGADVSIKDNQGRTALHYLAIYGSPTFLPTHGQVSFGQDMGQILLAAHADIEARDNEGETPLALAARSGRSDVFEWLVQHGANLDAPGRDGKTPRWIAAHTPGNPNPFRSVETDATSAAMWGRLDALQALLRGDPHLMYQTNWFGTPLRGAAMEHRTNVVDFLDHAGVRWDAVSAVLTGHDGKLREVLAATPAACNDRFYGSSLLHLAAAAGDVGCAAVLLEHHCDVAAQDPRGLSPLGVARLRQAREIVILLRLPGAQENVFDTIYCDDLPQLKRLLGRNRSLALATNQAGFATVEVAAGLGHPRLLERLFRAGCSAQFVNASSGRTPLHTAAFFNQTNTVGLLLKRGARTEAMDRWGFTPLHLAALNGAMDAGRLLLAWKVNPDMRGVPLAVLPTAPPDFYRHSALRGDTALHLAAIAGKPEFVRLLLLSGANVNATDFAGHTPLYLVRRTGGFEAVVQGMYRDFEVMSGRFKDGLPGSLLDTRSIWAGQSAVAQLLQDSGAKLSPVVGR